MITILLRFVVGTSIMGEIVCCYFVSYFKSDLVSPIWYCGTAILIGICRVRDHFPTVIFQVGYACAPSKGDISVKLEIML